MTYSASWVTLKKKEEYFAETDSTVNMKLNALLNAPPILCVGKGHKLETGSIFICQWTDNLKTRRTHPSGS